MEEILRPDAGILIVEDEVAIAENIRDILAPHGYTLFLAHNSADALRMVGDCAPDLVLMDINLGGDVDGIETAAKIREEFQTPLVSVTAYSDDETVHRAQATEPVGYLLKPFEAIDVLTTVRISLSNSRRQAETQRKAHRFDLTYEKLDQAVIFTDSAGAVQSLNSPALNLIGLDASTAVGGDLGQVLNLTIEERLQFSVERIIRTKLGSGGLPVVCRLVNHNSRGETAIILEKVEGQKRDSATAAAKASSEQGWSMDIVDSYDGRDEECCAAVLVINHFRRFRQRFGSAAGQIQVSYEQHIAQNVPVDCLIEPTSETALLLISVARAWPTEVEEQICHLARTPLPYVLELPSRSALLYLSASVKLIPPAFKSALPDQVRLAIEGMGQS